MTRVLRKYGYPPDLQEKATLTVLNQAEVLSEGWSRDIQGAATKSPNEYPGPIERGMVDRKGPASVVMLVAN